MENLKELIENQIKQEKKFAYAPNGSDDLAKVLKNEKWVKGNRLAAERAAYEDYRVEHQTDLEPFDELLTEGKVQIWDLREELERLE
jgi:hypothetical protein